MATVSINPLDPPVYCVGGRVNISQGRIVSTRCNLAEFSAGDRVILLVFSHGFGLCSSDRDWVVAAQVCGRYPSLVLYPYSSSDSRDRIYVSPTCLLHYDEWCKLESSVSVALDLNKKLTEDMEEHFKRLDGDILDTKGDIAKELNKVFLESMGSILS